jgi:pectate lyase
LTAQEVAAGFANRTLIFAAFNNGAGWDPAP